MPRPRTPIACRVCRRPFVPVHARHATCPSCVRDPDVRALLAIERRCRRNAWPFDLTAADVRQARASGCVYCGGRATGLDTYGNRNDGFTRANTVPACHECVMMKRGTSATAFVERAERIAARAWVHIDTALDAWRAPPAAEDRRIEYDDASPGWDG